MPKFHPKLKEQQEAEDLRPHLQFSLVFIARSICIREGTSPTTTNITQRRLTTKTVPTHVCTITWRTEARHIRIPLPILSAMKGAIQDHHPFKRCGRLSSIGSAGSGSTSYIGAGGSKTSTGNTTRGEGATGSRTQFHAPLEPEVVARLDELFFKFLQRICSDLNVCDSKGDPIHQPLMAKKMQRLEASTDFRPFKFRIQAFTNAFHESLVREGLTEDILPLRKVKVYLWKHRYISRFNEDGKKQKSKGNHVWNIEARKRPDPSSASSTSSTIGLSGAGSPEIKTVDGAEVMSTPQGKWEFREYSSRIAGQIIKFARVGVPYIYAPRIWDAQMSCPTAEFTSPWLPGWLKWHKGELRGIPGPDDKSCTITVIAEYVREGEKCRLEMDFPLTVSDPQKEGDLMDEDTQEQDQEEDDDEDEEQVGQEGGSSQGEDDAEDEGVEDDEDMDDDEDGSDDEKEGKKAHVKTSLERRSKRRRQT
ncbi:hypothetical protein BGZ91_002324 [Linnemannia elongata]|nr:hypothetical protein BGZ91_002324 [Linnemannia elongata]KAG0080780.1 hypothetical protein BGZ90_011290 [Linnemannia elongata]